MNVLACEGDEAGIGGPRGEAVVGIVCELEEFIEADGLNEDAGGLTAGTVTIEGDVTAGGGEGGFAGLVREVGERTNALDSGEGVVSIGSEGDFLEQEGSGEENSQGTDCADEIGVREENRFGGGGWRRRG